MLRVQISAACDGRGINNEKDHLSASVRHIAKQPQKNNNAATSNNDDEDDMHATN